MALPASRIVKVTREVTPRVSAARDFNKTLFMHTPTATTDLAALRAGATVRSYSSLDQVAEDWAAGTQPYAAASIYYQQAPRPRGDFAIGSYFPSAVDGRVEGGDVSIDQSAAQALGNAFAFSLMGAPITVDLSSATSPTDVATALQTGIQAVFAGVRLLLARALRSVRLTHT